jgi:tetratricopeptide (TPR) repeat protein
MPWAQAALQEAARIDPKDETIHQDLRNFAKIEGLAGDVESSIDNKNYKKALENVNGILKLSPDQIDARIKRVVILSMMSETKRAYDLCADLQRELGSNPNYLYAKGLALCYAGKTDNAKKVWAEGMRMDPDHKDCKAAIKRINKQEDAKQAGNDKIKA